MAKPLIVINYCVDGMPIDKAIRTHQELQQFLKASNVNDEYYTFIIPVKADSSVQVFYEKDQKEIQYEELKDMIETKMKVLTEKL
jgi:translation initiation factor 2 gamma subunit (eIF-2gamma)